MKKTVLKKSEILQSVRPVIIQNIKDDDLHPDSFTPFSSFGTMPSILNENAADVTTQEPLINQISPLMDEESLINDNMIESIDAEDSGELETSNIMDSMPPITSEPEAVLRIEDDNLTIDDDIPSLNEGYQNMQDEYSELQQQIESAKKELSNTQESIQSAETEAQNIIRKANDQRDGIHKEAQESAQEDGILKGIEKGKEESKRLITLLQTISSKIIDEKNSILTNIEADLVDLSLLIAAKVVKSITEEYKRVVYDNVVAAISKLKAKSDFIVKVNPADLPTIEKYKANLLQEINGLENFQLIEDPSVDKGGCIIISDFGSIDARISSQLAEIEEQVRRVAPIKNL